MDKNRQSALEIVSSYDGPKLRIMETCGTHTHEIFRLGIRRILPANLELISGPGCPVCVTPVSFIDEAVLLALEYGATICTFGDLLRVPGTSLSLAGARAQGARIRIVYAPMDAVSYAKQHPEESAVFLSVGFETTTPATCLAVRLAAADGVSNFSVLTANKAMPGAYRALKHSADLFLYPGHVHAITGTALCEEMTREGVSGVIAGFTSDEILTALAVAIVRHREGAPFFVNCYPRVVRPQGNPKAIALMNEMMDPCDSEWRGLGVIPDSGMRLKASCAAFDARKKFDLPPVRGHANPACRCGDVLRGACRPHDCPLFGKTCTPEHPVGACMVSNEGACSAWYRYAL
ncbi:MAG: hydrogenase formation protein HypD [Clostridiales bacterium]|nr:hydrogenase formation protein HypD [Clostridiales bacterium]